MKLTRHSKGMVYWTNAAGYTYRLNTIKFPASSTYWLLDNCLTWLSSSPSLKNFHIYLDVFIKNLNDIVNARSSEQERALPDFVGYYINAIDKICHQPQLHFTAVDIKEIDDKLESFLRPFSSTVNVLEEKVETVELQKKGATVATDYNKAGVKKEKKMPDASTRLFKLERDSYTSKYVYTNPATREKAATRGFVKTVPDTEKTTKMADRFFEHIANNKPTQWNPVINELMGYLARFERPLTPALMDVIHEIAVKRPDGKYDEALLNAVRLSENYYAPYISKPPSDETEDGPKPISVPSFVSAAAPVAVAAAAAAPIAAKVAPMPAKKEENTMPNNTTATGSSTLMNRVWEEAKKNAADGAWQTAAHQTVLTLREPTIAALEAKFGSSIVAGILGEALKTEIGEAGFALLLGTAISGLSTQLPPSVGKNPKVIRLAAELRKFGFYKGSLFMTELLMLPLRSKILELLKDLPEVEEQTEEQEHQLNMGSVRVGASSGEYEAMRSAQAEREAEMERMAAPKKTATM